MLPLSPSSDSRLKAIVAGSSLSSFSPDRRLGKSLHPLRRRSWFSEPQEEESGRETEGSWQPLLPALRPSCFPNPFSAVRGDQHPSSTSGRNCPPISWGFRTSPKHSMSVLLPTAILHVLQGTALISEPAFSLPPCSWPAVTVVWPVPFPRLGMIKWIWREAIVNSPCSKSSSHVTQMGRAWLWTQSLGILLDFPVVALEIGSPPGRAEWRVSLPWVALCCRLSGKSLWSSVWEGKGWYSSARDYSNNDLLLALSGSQENENPPLVSSKEWGQHLSESGAYSPGTWAGILDSLFYRLRSLSC